MELFYVLCRCSAAFFRPYLFQLSGRTPFSFKAPAMFCGLQNLMLGNAALGTWGGGDEIKLSKSVLFYSIKMSLCGLTF